MFVLLISILPEVISESDDMLSINLEDPDVLKDFNSILEQLPGSMQGIVTLEHLSTKNS